MLQTDVPLDGDEHLGVLVRGNNDIATIDQIGNTLGVKPLLTDVVPAVGEEVTVREWIEKRISISPDVCKLTLCSFRQAQ